MDSRLKDRLTKIDEHINKMFHIEHDFYQLEGSEKSLLSMLNLLHDDKSHAAREAKALASDEWRAFKNATSLKKAEFNRERRRYDLLLKAFDAEYGTMKIESQVIKRQL